MDIATAHLPYLSNILAQAVSDPDVLGQMRGAVQNFIESGQIWAFLIGITLGYFIRGFTSFG
ncbi:MAG: hypothetical protein WBG70_24660 [Spirulinaceae cyanobacterium]